MLVYLPGSKWLEGNTLLGCRRFGVFLTNSISFIDPHLPVRAFSPSSMWHSIFFTGWLRRGFCNSLKPSMTIGCCNIILYKNIANNQPVTWVLVSNRNQLTQSTPVHCSHLWMLSGTIQRQIALKNLRVIDLWSTILIVNRGDGYE